MNVLFVSSGNNNNGQPSNLILAQAQSLQTEKINIINFPIIGKGIIGYLKNIKAIKAAIIINEIDIIHAHYGYCALLSYFAKGNKKMVASLMGSDVIGDLGGSISSRILDKFIGVLTVLSARFLFDYTIVKSRSMVSFLLKGRDYKIIPNGVNGSVFYPMDKNEAKNKLNLSIDKKYILFASDPLREEKNFKLAKESVNLINDKNIELISIHNVSQEVLNLYYNACDVTISTSFYEGSPNVIKENLFCNRIIVSTDVGDVATNFNGVSNCFLTSFESKEVASKITQGLSKLESNGREKISHLQNNKIAKKITYIYNHLYYN
jgi:teichuronic acid biosynthesis glycosyltransferase TuaC